MNKTLKPTNYPALYTLVGVFFFWGFIAASNGVLIPFCKSRFELSQFQSQLIDSAFYFAYYIGAFLLFLFSVAGRKTFELMGFQERNSLWFDDIGCWSVYDVPGISNK